LAASCKGLGDVHVRLAERRTPDAAAHWSHARALYARALEIYGELRARGIVMVAGDADAARRGLARCDARGARERVDPSTMSRE
jgi:hypothetical protein